METVELYTIQRLSEGAYWHYNFYLGQWVKEIGGMCYTASMSEIDAVLSMDDELNEQAQIIVCAVRPEYRVNAKQWKAK